MKTSRLPPCLLVLLSLLLAGCTCKPYEPGEALSVSAYRQSVLTLTADEMEGRDAGSEGIELAKNYLIDRFRAAGLEPAFVIEGKASYAQPFSLPIGVDAEGVPVVAEIANVGAVLPGVGDLANEVIVVGGHYDHVGYGDIGSRARDRRGEIHPGADDNASGTAGVVLLARHFAQHADGTKPRRTVLFTCFAGEERGLHGSRYMVGHREQFAFGDAELVGMINLDMIGRLRSDELYVFGDVSGEEWRDWTNHVNKQVGLDLKWDVRAPGGSDHSMFIAGGVPGIFFNTWLHDDYHTPDDTADKVNYEGGVRVLELVAGLVDVAATTNDRLTYVAPAPRRPRPYLGVMLGEAQRGVLIENVAPESPMQKAGAKPNDVLLVLGGVEVNSPGDIRSYLVKAEPGDEVVAVILRDGEQIELDVRLDLRR